jgi:hypothetical protein
MSELNAFSEAIKSSSLFEREMRKKEAEWEKRGITGSRSPLKSSPGGSTTPTVSAWDSKKSFTKLD